MQFIRANIFEALEINARHEHSAVKNLLRRLSIVFKISSEGNAEIAMDNIGLSRCTR